MGQDRVSGEFVYRNSGLLRQGRDSCAFVQWDRAEFPVPLFTGTGPSFQCLCLLEQDQVSSEFVYWDSSLLRQDQVSSAFVYYRLQVYNPQWIFVSL